MGAEITELDALDPDYDLKQIKVEDKFKEAYSDRYRRLGYHELSCTIEEEDGKKYAVSVMRRERLQAGYVQLREIEEQIELLLLSAVADEQAEEEKNRLRFYFRIIFWSGVAICATGLVMLVCGFLLNKMWLALGGWGIVILGAVAIIVWSFLCENKRIRKVDIQDDREHPGFGTDKLSLQIEENLCRADEIRGEKTAKKKNSRSK